ncbi:hypothetical protein MBAV_001248 [Candidatus Magnetobacterium bavaricum]|uniref:Uncharacterized protein n=1 Tax=Candidatus Magnetobacterium bavaricum TaxID=29290 RepID=A0A0F3H0U2_9BACT|nr:hypothetical protein MBAV_001248 [Candidatus Magnetobacterium bavaricum]
MVLQGVPEGGAEGARNRPLLSFFLGSLSIPVDKHPLNLLINRVVNVDKIVV